MSVKTYVLLDVFENRATGAASRLRRAAGVTMVERLDGSPNLMLAVTADDRQLLAHLTARAISRIDDVTRSVQLLPVDPKTGT